MVEILMKIIILFLNIIMLSSYILCSNFVEIFTKCPITSITNKDQIVYDAITRDTVQEIINIVKLNEISLNSKLLFNLSDSVCFVAHLELSYDHYNIISDQEEIYGYLIINDSKIRGTISYKGQIYTIKPLLSDINVICIINPIYMKAKKLPFFLKETNITLVKDKIKQQLMTFTPSDCKVRILVTYTNAAIVSWTNEQNLNAAILKSIEETNTDFANSGVRQRIELARSIKNNYIETGTSDVWEFQSLINSNFDYINNIRNLYKADIMVLLFSISGPYPNGESCMIGERGREYAYISINVGRPGTFGEYSVYHDLSHEIGHVSGCGHNIEASTNKSAFSFGHGYLNSTIGFSDIMGIGNYQRIPFFSNSIYTYNGGIMGNDECCNCARVLNEQESTVKEFYYENNYDCAIPAEHNIPSYNIADFLSDWRIRNVGSFTAQPNSEVTFSPLPFKS